MSALPSSVLASWPAKSHSGTIQVFRGEHPSLAHHCKVLKNVHGLGVGVHGLPHLSHLKLNLRNCGALQNVAGLGGGGGGWRVCPIWN